MTHVLVLFTCAVTLFFALDVLERSALLRVFTRNLRTFHKVHVFESFSVLLREQFLIPLAAALLEHACCHHGFSRASLCEK